MTRVAALWWSLLFAACSCVQQGKDLTQKATDHGDPRRSTAQLVQKLQAEQKNRAFVVDLVVSEQGELKECRVKDSEAESGRKICQSIKAWEFSGGEKGHQFTVSFGRGSLR